MVYTSFLDAGWSSPVARRAHNPKVEGSNPSPAILSFNRLMVPNKINHNVSTTLIPLLFVLLLRPDIQLYDEC